MTRLKEKVAKLKEVMSISGRTGVSMSLPDIFVARGRGLDNTQWAWKFHAAHRCTSTGILQCVRTLTVSLPRTIAEMPWRPCEAMTIRSQFFNCAVSMIA